MKPFIAFRSLVMAALVLPSTAIARDGVLDRLEKEFDRIEALEKDLRTANAEIERVGRAILEGAFTRARHIHRSYSNVTRSTEIPSSQGAVYCALGGVDDDTPAGQCVISEDGGKWSYQTGGHDGDNNCSVVCLFLE